MQRKKSRNRVTSWNWSVSFVGDNFSQFAIRLSYHSHSVMFSTIFFRTFFLFEINLAKRWNWKKSSTYPSFERKKNLWVTTASTNDTIERQDRTHLTPPVIKRLLCLYYRIFRFLLFFIRVKDWTLFKWLLCEFSLFINFRLS